MKTLLSAAATTLVSATLAMATPAPQDAAAGRALFKGCVSCHGAGGEGNALGPDIRGIVGQAAASQPDYAYSAALKRSKKVWTQPALAAFLLKPQAAVPGTRMAYPGAGSPEKAAALAAYVATLR